MKVLRIKHSSNRISGALGLRPSLGRVLGAGGTAALLVTLFGCGTDTPAGNAEAGPTTKTLTQALVEDNDINQRVASELLQDAGLVVGLA